jgi:hypothetical protein
VLASQVEFPAVDSDSSAEGSFSDDCSVGTVVSGGVNHTGDGIGEEESVASNGTVVAGAASAGRRRSRPASMYITGIPKAWGLGTFPDINQFFTICLDNFRHF